MRESITDQNLRNEIDQHLLKFNYTDSQRKTIINLMQPKNIKETESGHAWHDELLDVLHEWGEHIGQPPYKAPAYKGRTQDEWEQERKTRRKGQRFNPGKGKMNKGVYKNSYSTSQELREKGARKAQERQKAERKRELGL